MIEPRDFLGFVDDEGHFALDDRAAFLAHAAMFKGHEVTLTIQRRKRKRSLAQNRWLWGVAMPLIADHCGYDAHEHERLHYDLLSVRFGTTAIAPMLPNATPRIVPAKTSSQLTTVEFSEYMDWLVRYAAETLGVVLPLPDEIATPRQGAA